MGKLFPVARWLASPMPATAKKFTASTSRPNLIAACLLATHEAHEPGYIVRSQEFNVVARKPCLVGRPLQGFRFRGDSTAHYYTKRHPNG